MRNLSRRTSKGPRSARPGAVWKQLALLTYPALVALLVRRQRRIERDLARCRRLHDYCRLRFGKAPRLPALDVGS